MIVDIHAHVGQHPLMEFKQEPQELLSVIRRYGIDKTFVLPFPSMYMKKVNDSLAAIAKKNQDVLVGFGFIEPSSEDARNEVKRIVDLGLRGILLDYEFHPLVGLARRFVTEFFADLEQILGPVMDHNLPILINSPNIETGHDTRKMRGAYYEGLDRLALKFPSVRFVVNVYWQGIEELIPKHQNIIIDSGGRNGVTEAIRFVREFGPTRICFGSESPQNHQAIGIKEIRSARLPSEYKALLLGGNAERLFKDILHN